jgi:hypothetical protein
MKLSAITTGTPHMCGLGKPVTWSKFKILSYLYQLKAYEDSLNYDNISIQTRDTTY